MREKKLGRCRMRVAGGVFSPIPAVLPPATGLVGIDNRCRPSGWGEERRRAWDWRARRTLESPSSNTHPNASCETSRWAKGEDQRSITLCNHVAYVITSRHKTTRSATAPLLRIDAPPYIISKRGSSSLAGKFLSASWSKARALFWSWITRLHGSREGIWGCQSYLLRPSSRELR